MPMPTGNGENPQFYGQWTIEDSQKLTVHDKFNKTKKLSAWIPDLSTSKVQGSLPP